MTQEEMFNDNKYLTEEQMLTNFNSFTLLCSKVGDHRSGAVERMLDEMGLRLSTAPASSRRDYHAAYPGGLVDHSLRVLRYALQLRKSVDLFEDIVDESIIFASLFHDIGKVGGPGPDGADYYIVEGNDWHRKNGKYYNVNQDPQKMQNVDNSLLILLHYGIGVTQDEYLAIRLNDGAYADENKQYLMHEPRLAMLIHMADRLACETEKSSTVT